MQATRTPFGLHWPVTNDPSLYRRIDWLIAVNEYEAERRRLFRTGLEEQQMLLMSRPVATQQAYALFGLLLGTLVPFAIFMKVVGYGFPPKHSESAFIFFICLAMNVTCALMGRRMGRRFSERVDDFERSSWTRMLFYSLSVGLCWGLATGALGGALFFIIGGLFGAGIAAVVGAIAFPLFTSLHRILARGGMIDARHLWPLACGVTMVIAAFILGM